MSPLYIMAYMCMYTNMFAAGADSFTAGAPGEKSVLGFDTDAV
jgi:hypothetical protein